MSAAEVQGCPLGLSELYEQLLQPAFDSGALPENAKVAGRGRPDLFKSSPDAAAQPNQLQAGAVLKGS